MVRLCEPYVHARFQISTSTTHSHTYMHVLLHDFKADSLLRKYAYYP